MNNMYGLLRGPKNPFLLIEKPNNVLRKVVKIKTQVETEIGEVKQEYGEKHGECFITNSK